MAVFQKKKKIENYTNAIILSIFSGGQKLENLILQIIFRYFHSLLTAKKKLIEIWPFSKKKKVKITPTLM